MKHSGEQQNVARCFCQHGQERLASGDRGAAEACFQRAIQIDPDCLQAHEGLARCRMPGPPYLVVLDRFHKELRPGFYLEIGVDQGLSLKLARAPTLAVGVDPRVSGLPELTAPTRIFNMTSREFFESGVLQHYFPDRRVDMAFIDGSHLFEDALDDFIHIESVSHSGSVIIVHDCIPLDEATSSRDRATTFYTGDVWKLAVCLKDYRTDLSCQIVRTPPSGLLVIQGLDPQNRFLAQHREKLIAEYRPRGFCSWLMDQTIESWFIPNDERRVNELIRLITSPAAGER